MSAPVTHRPDVFDVRDIDQAKAIILTPELGRTTDERWALETPYLANLIFEQTRPRADTVVLDYGCGIGRLSKALIEGSGCKVIGADTSNDMRAMAPGYVGSGQFTVCDPRALAQSGARCDVAIAVWVLQHCAFLDLDLDVIKGALKPGGLLFVVNEIRRCLPTDHGWIDDGRDLRAVLAADYDVVAQGRLDPAVVTEPVSERTFWAVYRARELSRMKREMLERKQQKLARKVGRRQA